MFQYDRATNTQTVMNKNHEELLVTTYDARGRPLQIMPRGPVEGLNMTYDRQGRLAAWNSGDMNVIRIFDDKTGQLLERRLANKAVYRYIYKNGIKVIRAAEIVYIYFYWSI